MIGDMNGQLNQIHGCHISQHFRMYQKLAWNLENVDARLAVREEIASVNQETLNAQPYVGVMVTALGHSNNH